MKTKYVTPEVVAVQFESAFMLAVSLGGGSERVDPDEARSPSRFDHYTFDEEEN